MKIKLSKKISKDKICCLLCPHLCDLKQGQVGKCFVHKNNGEKIKLINYGLVSSMAIEPIEKKPFKHFLQDSKTPSKTLCFSLSGKCNLHCKFCENFPISQSNKIEGKYFSITNLISAAKEKHCKSISMSYNEPTLSYEFLIDLGERCKDNELKFLLKTNAYINKEPWKEICKVVDAINIDWKGSEEQFKAITGVSVYVLQDRIKEAYDYGVHLEISFPLYYQDDEIEDEMKIAGEFLSSLSSDIPCHLLRISPSYKYSDFIFKSENMDRAKSVLSKYINNIYVVV